MADEIRQLAFKKFTTSEIQAGSAANVLTTDASTHYVIKGIEATQESETDAVEATATIGLTAGLAGGEYTSLGTIAKKGRVGLSGSAIMDASSTLTVRPEAKSMNFADEKINQGYNSTTTNAQYAQAVYPTINGVAEPTLNSETTIDKSSVTYSGGSYNSMQPYGSSNYIIQHTNANGVELRLLFGTGSSSGSYFEVWNADGSYYGYYYDTYDTPIFDGERYVFWVFADGASTTRVRWYDLDESTTNLLAANTTGGSSGADFWHGQTGVWNDGPSINSRTTYDNHLNFFYKNRHTNSKRYIGGYSGGNQNMWMAEMPDTLTNDSSTTPTVKWLYLNGTSQNNSGADPFGNNSGNAWNMTSVLVGQMVPTSAALMRLTYEPENGNYLLWYCYNSHYWTCFSWTQAQWDSANTGNRFDPNGDNYGVRMVSIDSCSNIKMHTNYYINWSSNNGYVGLQSNFYTSNNSETSPASSGAVYMDGKNWYMKNNISSAATYEKCFKCDMEVGDVSGVTNMLPNTTISSTYGPDLFVSVASPTASTISGRNYLNAPGLKVRVTGILSDQ